MLMIIVMAMRVAVAVTVAVAVVDVVVIVLMRMRIGTVAVAVAVAVAVISPATASHGIMTVEPSSPAVRIVHVRLFVAATAADADAATPTAFFGSKMGMVIAIPPISKISTSAASPATAVGIAVAAVGVVGVAISRMIVPKNVAMVSRRWRWARR